MSAGLLVYRESDGVTGNVVVSDREVVCFKLAGIFMATISS